MIIFFLTLFVGYLLGSIPFGYLVGRLKKGIDIRNFGSGNIGTTNILRVLGTVPAIMVLMGDAGKGIASVYLGRSLASFTGISPEISGGLAGFSSIVGHNWSIFLRFRGGKGVATSAGVFLTLIPLPFLFSLMTMALVVFLTRYVSLGSMLAAGSLPLFVLLWVKNRVDFYLALSAAVAGLILFNHRSNLRRLLRGKERKLGKGHRKG